MFQIGDKVVMNGSYYIDPKHKDKVFLVASGEMELTYSNGKVVRLNDLKCKGNLNRLEGILYHVDGLTKVK